MADNYKEIIQKMIEGKAPMSVWQTNVDVKSLDDFEEWLASQAQQMLEIQRRFMNEMGDKENDLITHCASKGNAFLSALYTYRRAKFLSEKGAPNDQ